jgi:hypothetical protein
MRVNDLDTPRSNEAPQLRGGQIIAAPWRQARHREHLYAAVHHLITDRTAFFEVAGGGREGPMVDALSQAARNSFRTADAQGGRDGEEPNLRINHGR